jgi:transcriptional regulator with XRE-family HTH domain
MGGENRIGAFLRARRELVRPEDVGLPDLGRRRVPGLRREELAMLAGVSNDYYVRLEQGRDQHPSEQVLDALARVLRLDDEAAAHLHELARTRAAAAPPRGGAGRAGLPGLSALLASWSHTPAFVLGRRMDVLAANALAQALHPACAAHDNMVRSVFLDPAARRCYPDFETAARDTVAALRASVGPDLDDPRLVELVGELSLKSEEFRRLWARHDVRPKTGGTKRIAHPQLGELELRTRRSASRAPTGRCSSPTTPIREPAERALALLSSMTAGAAEAAPAGTEPSRVARPNDSGGRGVAEETRPLSNRRSSMSSSSRRTPAGRTACPRRPRRT